MSARRSLPLDVVFWLPAVNPYWARRFSALEDSGQVRFACWFNAVRGAGREWVVPAEDLQFPHEFLPEAPWRRYLRLASLYARADPSRIFTFHFEPSLWPASVHGLRREREVAFYVEKSWDSYVQRTWVKERLKRLLFKIPAVVFVPGEDAEEYVRRYRSANASVRTLPHVVDLELLAQARTERRPSKALRLLYLGHLIESKGLRCLMDALDAIRPASGSVSLRMVGSGDMALQIDRWAMDCPVDVIRQNFVQAAELVPVLADADVLVFPTLADTYGLVVTEAMAAGLAVLSSSAVGEIGSRLLEGPNPPRGRIFPVADSKALEAAIEDLIEDSDQVAGMKRASEAFADGHLGLEHWVKAIEDWCRAEATPPRGSRR